MVAAGWAPTVESYLGRVTKARILGAVREARGERAAQLIDHLKKGEMAEKAQELLVGSGWLPEPLRTPGRTRTYAIESTPVEPLEPFDEQAGEETALNGGESAMGEDEQQSEDEPVSNRCLDPTLRHGLPMMRSVLAYDAGGWVGRGERYGERSTERSIEHSASSGGGGDAGRAPTCLVRR